MVQRNWVDEATDQGQAGGVGGGLGEVFTKALSWATAAQEIRRVSRAKDLQHRVPPPGGHDHAGGIPRSQSSHFSREAQDVDVLE